MANLNKIDSEYIVELAFELLWQAIVDEGHDTGITHIKPNTKSKARKLFISIANHMTDYHRMGGDFSKEKKNLLSGLRALYGEG